MRIHIVEDDMAVSDALSIVLSDFGHAVTCYPDAETFLEKQSLTSEDLVIIDVGLPGITGDEVIKILNDLPETPRIIAISGRPKNMLDRSLSEFSSLTVLRKPLSLSVLTEHLHQA